MTSVIFNRVQGMIEGNVYSKFGKIWMKNVAVKVVTRKLVNKSEIEQNKNSYYMKKRLDTRHLKIPTSS